MRIRQITAQKVSVCSEVFCTSNSPSLTVGFEHQMKGSHLIKKRSAWTMDQAGNRRTNIYVFHRFGSSRQSNKGSSVIAQPMFVFKKEQHNKRPADDSVCKTEIVPTTCSRKRARPSFYSFQPSVPLSCRAIGLGASSAGDRRRAQLHHPASCVAAPPIAIAAATEPPPPPSLPRSGEKDLLGAAPLPNAGVPILPTCKVKKNNVFMTSGFLEEGMGAKPTKQDLLATMQRDVLRPAILQPPQPATCRLEKKRTVENLLKGNHETGNEVSEDTHSCTEIAENPPLPLQISSTNSFHNPLLKGRPFSDGKEHSNFVFGENIVERVLRPENSPELQSKVESATAYTSNKTVQSCLLEKIEITTGEEEEHNVLQINCRLFLFNKALLSWIERGSGSLRLNDTSSSQHGMLQSRLVMRNHGSLRLILNTKLWTQMVIDRANRRSVFITATDLEDSAVKVFLIQASTKDTDSLYAAIHHRLVALRNFAKQECDVNQVEPKLDVHQYCDSDDEDNEKRALQSSNRLEHSRWIRRRPVVCL